MQHTHRPLQATLKQIGLLIWISMTLAACTTSGTQPPVVDGSSSAPISRDPVEIEEATPGAPGEEQSVPQPSAATTSLVLAARTATDEQNFNDAISYLERAVRIAPRDPQLWIELSKAHLADGNTTAADQHARKAIALAGSDAGLIRRAWLQVADIREAQGSLSEARAIRRRYAMLRG